MEVFALLPASGAACAKGGFVMMNGELSKLINGESMRAMYLVSERFESTKPLARAAHALKLCWHDGLLADRSCRHGFQHLVPTSFPRRIKVTPPILYPPGLPFYLPSRMPHLACHPSLRPSPSNVPPGVSFRND
jgi:hypothetical protein